MRREKRLTLWMVAGVVAPLLAYGVFAAASYESALRDAEAITHDRVAVLRGHLTEVFRLEERMLSLIDSLLAARDARPTDAFLNEALGDRHGFPITAIDGAGRFVAASHGAPLLTPEALANQGFLSQVMASGEVVFGAPVTVADTTAEGAVAEVIPLGLRRRQGDGAFIASVSLGYLRGIFEDTVGTTRDVDAAVVALLSEDGRFLARRPKLDRPLSLPQGSILMAMRNRTPSGTFRAAGVSDGLERIISYGGVGRYPLTIAFAMTRDSALAGWRTNLAAGGAAAFLAALLLGSLAHRARRQARFARRTEGRLKAEVAARTAEAESRAAEAEEASRDARRALSAVERADRAKVHFLAAVSHDLRQPLQALRLYLDFSESRGAEVARRALGEQAHQALDQMERLLRSTLEISMLDNGLLDAQMRDVALGPLLQELHEEFCGEAGKKGLDLVVVPSSLVVRSDPILLRRILTNLVSNAIRYTLQGRIVIGVRRGAVPSIIVGDTGVGLSAEEAGRIFEPRAGTGRMDHQAGADRGQGLGLGLSIVRRMAALLGHDLDVTSIPGRGSCFSVRLGTPAATTGVATPDEAVTLAEHSPQAGSTRFTDRETVTHVR